MTKIFHSAAKSKNLNILKNMEILKEKHKSNNNKNKQTNTRNANKNIKISNYQTISYLFSRFLNLVIQHPGLLVNFFNFLVDLLEFNPAVGQLAFPVFEGDFLKGTEHLVPSANQIVGQQVVQFVLLRFQLHTHAESLFVFALQPLDVVV